MRIDLIYTFFDVYEQEWFTTDLPDGALENETTLKEFLNELIDDHQRVLLCKVSCCILGGVIENIPEWFLKSNGKIWFNDHLREEYNLD